MFLDPAARAFLRALRPWWPLLLTATLAAEDVVPIPDWARGRTFRIREVIVHPGDVFDLREEDNVLYRAANLLHVTTRRRIIARELLFAPGQVLDWHLIEDTERKLRALRFITSARVEVLRVSEEEVDVHVWTRDKFTLRGEVSGSYVGGVLKGRFSLGEQNLLGWGKTLKLTVVRRTDRRYEHVKYADPLLFGTRLTLGTELARSDEGERESASLTLPFWSIDSAWSAGLWGRTERSEANFYRGGVDESTDVPRRIRQGRGFLAYRWGPRYRKQSLTLTLDLDDRAYREAEGPIAAEIEIPPHALTATGLVRYGREWTSAFRKERELDTLTQVEDVPVGITAGATLGPAARREYRAGTRWRLAHGLDLLAVLAPWEGHVLAARIDALGRYGGGRYRGWETRAFYHHYFKGLPRQTLVGSVAFDAVFEGDDLARELTLGEDSGLRGYEARRLYGAKRLRLTLEDRIFTPLELLSFRLGAVVFADAGIAWRRGEAFRLRDLKKSLGLGLRIGSEPILGYQTLRIDVAFPLDRIEGERQGVSVSVAIGQNVTLFANPEALEEEF